MPSDVSGSNFDPTATRGSRSNSTRRSFLPSWSSFKKTLSDVCTTHSDYSRPERLPESIRSKMENLDVKSINSMSRDEAIAAAEYATAKARQWRFTTGIASTLGAMSLLSQATVVLPMTIRETYKAYSDHRAMSGNA